MFNVLSKYCFISLEYAESTEQMINEKLARNFAKVSGLHFSISHSFNLDLDRGGSIGFEQFTFSM